MYAMPLDLGPCIVVRGLHLPLSPAHLFTFAWRDTVLGFGHFIDFIILPTPHNRHELPMCILQGKKEGNCTKEIFSSWVAYLACLSLSISLLLAKCWKNVYTT